MTKYGEAAVLATKIIKEEKSCEPREAWLKATKKVFPSSNDMQVKGCPKGAFLGLCNVGMIKGILKLEHRA